MSQTVVISECFVRPTSEVQHSEKHHYLSPLALKLLSLGNTQYGLLFNTASTSLSSSNNNSNLFFDNLKLSVSHALVYFYPLAGRLVTQTYDDDDDHSCSIFVDCHEGPGARLIHASALGVSVVDVVNRDTDVPLVVQSFFDLCQRQVNHDGHTRALLSVQMTELVDGLVIGCCINHCVADGTSLSHFLNMLSQIFVLRLSNTSSDNNNHISLHSVPVIKPPPSLSKIFQTLKLRQVDQCITRFHEGHLLRDRIFHFSTALMSKLKTEANNKADASTNTITLSSYKALCGLVWKSITRARNLPYNATTTFVLTVNIRSRLDPPLPPTHFANCFVVATATAKVGELITEELRWGTMLIHDSVNKVDHIAAAEALGVSSDKSNINSGGGGVVVEEPGYESLGPNPVVMGGSPWFDFEGVDFGVGKPVAVRTGYSNRADGKLTAFPGLDGPGSVDLQVGLLSQNMSAFLLDEEFMNYVS